MRGKSPKTGEKMKDFKQVYVLAMMLFFLLLQELMKQLNIIQVSGDESSHPTFVLGYNLICADSFIKHAFVLNVLFPISSVISSLTHWVFF